MIDHIKCALKVLTDHVMLSCCVGWFMCQKDGMYGWVPGSFLVSKSAVVSVNTADVLGFASSISNCTDFQNSKYNIE